MCKHLKIKARSNNFLILTTNIRNSGKQNKQTKKQRVDPIVLRMQTQEQLKMKGLLSPFKRKMQTNKRTKQTTSFTF